MACLKSRPPPISSPSRRYHGSRFTATVAVGRVATVRAAPHRQNRRPASTPRPQPGQTDWPGKGGAIRPGSVRGPAAAGSPRFEGCAPGWTALRSGPPVDGPTAVDAGARGGSRDGCELIRVPIVRSGTTGVARSRANTAGANGDRGASAPPPAGGGAADGDEGPPGGRADGPPGA